VAGARPAPDGAAAAVGGADRRLAAGGAAGWKAQPGGRAPASAGCRESGEAADAPQRRPTGQQPWCRMPRIGQHRGGRPDSITRPAYMTTTWSVFSAITPRSWLTRTTRRRPRRRSRNSFRICAWMVASTAVVARRRSAPAPVGQRHGDHDALAHAAGKLVRELACAAFRRLDADPAEQRDGSLPGRRRPRAESWTVSASTIWAPTTAPDRARRRDSGRRRRHPCRAGHGARRPPSRRRRGRRSNRAASRTAFSAAGRRRRAARRSCRNRTRRRCQRFAAPTAKDTPRTAAIAVPGEVENRRRGVEFKIGAEAGTRRQRWQAR